MRRRLRAAAFAARRFTTVISPPRITKVQPARIGHGTSHRARRAADQSARAGIAGKGADRCASTSAEHLATNS